jgi:hypothetical protein
VTPWPVALQALSEVERELVQDWPWWVRDVAPSYDRLFMGTRSATPAGGRKRIMPTADGPWQGGEGAKAWLRALLKQHGSPRSHGKPFRRQQQDLAWLRCAAPQMVPEARPGEEWWIDLEKAYWSIYQPFSLDLIYRRDQGIVTRGRIPFEDALLVEPHSDVGRAVVGHAARQSATVMVRGRMLREPGQNFWLQPHLWAVTQDTLHAVALDMERLGAVAVATDGYCFTGREQALTAIDLLANRWRLRAKFKEAKWPAGKPRRYIEPLEPRQVYGLIRSRQLALGSP